MNPDEDVLGQFPKATAKRHGLLPLVVDDDAVMVATCAVIEPEMEEELRLRYGKPAKPVIVTPAEMAQGITRYYTSEVADAAPAAGGTAKKERSVPFDRLDDRQKRERRQLGVIAICWAIVIPAFGVYLLSSDPGYFPADRRGGRRRRAGGGVGLPDLLEVTGPGGPVRR